MPLDSMENPGEIWGRLRQVFLQTAANENVKVVSGALSHIRPNC